MRATFDLEREILDEHSRRQAERIAAWVGKDAARFARLIALLMRGEDPIPQRAAWAVGICAERHPALAVPHLGKMIARMNRAGAHDAVRRNVLRILQDADVPPGLAGRVAETCFRELNAGDAPIAVKVFAMSAIARLAATRPDLARELRLVIGVQLPYSGAGFRACARKVLAAIKS